MLINDIHTYIHYISFTSSASISHCFALDSKPLRTLSIADTFEELNCLLEDSLLKMPADVMVLIVAC